MQVEDPHPRRRAFLDCVTAGILAFLWLTGVAHAAAGAACDWGQRDPTPAESRTEAIATCKDCQPIAKEIDAANDEFTKSWILLRGTYDGCHKLQSERAEVEYSIMPLDREISTLEGRKSGLEPRIAELRRLQRVWQDNFDASFLADGRTRTYREVYSEWLDAATLEMGEINRRLVEAKQEVTPLREKVAAIVGKIDTLSARQSQLEGRIRRLEVKLRELLERLARCEHEKCTDLPLRDTRIPDSLPPQVILDVSVHQADFSKIYLPECPACREVAKALNDATAKAKAMQQQLRDMPKEITALEKTLEDAQAPVKAAKAALAAARQSGDPAGEYDAFRKYEAAGRATSIPAQALQDRQYQLWRTERDLENLALEIRSLEQALRACEKEQCTAAPPPIEGPPETRTDAVRTPGVVPVRRPSVADLPSVQDGLESAPPGGVVIPVPQPEPRIPDTGTPDSRMGASGTNDAQRMLDGLLDQERHRRDGRDADRRRDPEEAEERL